MFFIYETMASNSVIVKDLNGLQTNAFDISGLNTDMTEPLPMYETPFEQQTTYGQRISSKNFNNQSLTTNPASYGDLKPSESDLQNYLRDRGEEDYHRSEPFAVTRLYSGAENAWTSSRPSRTTLEESLGETENFTVAGKDFNLSTVIVIIVLIILFSTISLKLYCYKYGKCGATKNK